jgi:hypothetical protein
MELNRLIPGLNDITSGARPCGLRRANIWSGQGSPETALVALLQQLRYMNERFSSAALRKPFRLLHQMPAGCTAAPQPNISTQTRAAGPTCCAECRLQPARYHACP